MTIRRGMADYRQAGAGGIIFMGLLQAQGQEMTYEQRKILYHAIYVSELAKFEVLEDTIKTNPKTYEKIVTSLKLLGELTEQADTDYKSGFESHNSYGGLENAFVKLLGLELSHLWIVAVHGRMIENVIDDEKVLMA